MTYEPRMVVLLQAEQFQGITAPTFGLLVGLQLPSENGSESHAILGRCGCVSSPTHIVPALAKHGLAMPMWAESWDRVRGCFPGGCGMCGAFIAVKEGGRELVRDLLSHTDLLEVVGDRVIVLVQSVGLVAFEARDLSCIEEVGVAPVGDYLSSNTCLLRVTSSLPAVVDSQQPTPERLLAQLPSRPPAFLLPSLSFLLPHLSHDVQTSSTRNLRQLLQSSDEKEPFLPVELLLIPESSAEPLTMSISSSLVGTWTQLDIPIDTLALVHLDLSLKAVATVLWAGVVRQMMAVASAMLWKPSSLHNAAIHHFPPSSLHLCPLSIPYPATPVADPGTYVDDLALTSLRRDWHTALALPFDFPRLRTTNQHYFSPPRGHVTEEHKLLCPHTALSYVPQGTVAMVTGQYAYYHYQQNNFSDTGWGCAYRSLQTIWSWFNLQGFTSEAPPTHHQIQEALAATGDKPGQFVGSREWIGSIEVSTVLTYLLKIECRIHQVSRGSEMSGVGRVLLHHFTTEGTPVMIGGGVLAHTILGVDYNTSSGAIKFLILDPHYTGQEDLTTILKKGWCGWKPVSFWEKKAHYNMCLPLRPREI